MPSPVMPASPRRLPVATALVLTLALALPVAAAGQQAPAPATATAAAAAALEAAWTTGLGEEPGAVLGFLFEVTFMKIDVAEVEVRLADPDAAAIAVIVDEGGRNDRRRDRVADVLHAAAPVAYGMTFKRDSDLGKFFKGMLGNMERAVAAGEITAPEYARVDREYRALMAPYGERGVRKGDRLLYRLDAGTGHLALIGVDGAVLLDQALDEVWTRAVRASFTGRESKMRDELGELPWRD